MLDSRFVSQSGAWGTNMAPYSVLDRPKSLALVKTVLAAGKVTSATP
jgi:hypothetical protein